jgi:hypothetical protein
VKPVKLTVVAWVKIVGYLASGVLAGIAAPLIVAVDKAYPTSNYGPLILLWCAIITGVATIIYGVVKAAQDSPVATHNVTITDNKTGLETTIATVNPPGTTTPPTEASTKGTTP